MSTGFLHGVEIAEIDAGTRPIRTVRSSVIGVVGTAPDADATAFPLNTPVLVAGSRREAAELDMTGNRKGTLPEALDGIFDQAGAMVVVVRVAEGATFEDTRANVIGGVDADGQLQGVQALKAAKTELDLTPRLLCAPHYTHQRTQDGITGVGVDSAGQNYSPEPVVAIDGDGSGAEAVAEVDADGYITDIRVTETGWGYTGTPTVTITDPGGAGAAAVANVSDGAISGIQITDQGDGAYSKNTTVTLEDHTVVATDDLAGLDPDGDGTEEWTLDANWSHDAANDKFDHTAGAADDLVRTWGGLTTGEHYTAVVEVAGMTAGTLDVTWGDGSASITADGIYRITGSVASTEPDLVMSATSDFDGSVTAAEVQNAPETEASLSVTVQNGLVTDVTIDSAGSGYGDNLQVLFSDSGGTGAAASAFVGAVRNAVVSEMLGLADSMRAIIVADGPSKGDTEAINYRNDYGSDRVYVVDPWVKVVRGSATVSEPPSPRVAGIVARVDQNRGFWWSPSNKAMYGIVGTERPIEFAWGDRNSRANYLNENEVTTIIREEGFRLWGNRTTSADPKYAFLNVRRTADMIHDSLLRAHLWAVDRNITSQYVESLVDGVNAYLQSLEERGAILGGVAWADPELNTKETLQKGEVYIDFDFTPPAPAEHITFRSHLVNDYLTEVVTGD